MNGFLPANTACWIQVTSGRGPAECQYAAARLTEIIVGAAADKGVGARTIETTAGVRKGTLLSALISLSGADGLEFAESWAGSLLWISESPYRPNHRRKNWFVGVDVLAPPDIIETEVRVGDVRFQAVRASGPGGQHVNTTDSAVRATHGPSGISVVAREERSQHMNKKLALARIASRLASMQCERRSEADLERRTKHDRLKRGDAVRVFKGPKFREVH